MRIVELSAPREYILLTREQRKEICNGCGAKGGIPIPDSFLFLDISEACNIHDFRYWIGGTQEDKDIADEEFLDNLLTIIQDVNFFDELDHIREVEAHIYYIAVKEWGDEAFNFKEI